MIEDVYVITNKQIATTATGKYYIKCFVGDNSATITARMWNATKEIFAQIDVLTLSATPIPRTLYMALMGARDMSTIDTPPPNRVPVHTAVAPYDERLIRDSIQRELRRGGQVFFLHNRVKSIDLMRRKLQELVPEARLLVGHGQMDKDELEVVMRQFVHIPFVSADVLNFLSGFSSIVINIKS